MAVLVAYASKHGATREVAERIGAILRSGGADVAVLPVDEVGEIEAYDAVVLGSAVYYGKWKKEASAFLEEHRFELAQRQVWLFSSGPTAAPAEPLHLQVSPHVGSVHARDHRVFGGSLDPAKLSFLERFIVRGVKAPMVDFRDWEEIEAWATAIREQLRQPVAA